MSLRGFTRQVIIDRPTLYVYW